MGHRDAFLEIAELAVRMLDAPEVVGAWDKPSALAEWNVGGLAGHLAAQIFIVRGALGEPAPEAAPLSLLEHYTRVAWVDEPLDGETNTRIRAGGDGLAADGAAALAAGVRAAVAELRAELPRTPGDRAVLLRHTGWILTLDDLLLTRMMELAVHMDDLAVSAGITAPEIPQAALEPVLTLLTNLAVRRHGQAAVLRALTRAERSPAAINAF